VLTGIASKIAVLLLLPVTVLAHPDLEEQIAAITRHIQSTPHDASLYLRRGELFRLHSQWDKAQSDYDNAGRLDPQSKDVPLARATLFFDSGRPDQARPILDALIDQPQPHTPALLLRAKLFTLQNNLAGAIGDYTRAIALSTMPEADWFIERSRLQAKSDPAASLAGLEEAIQRLGSLVTLQMPALELELKLKRFDAALKRLDSIHARSPRREIYLAQRAEILEASGHKAEARATYTAALTAWLALPEFRRTSASAMSVREKVEAGLNRLAQEKPHARH
jgi:tetratricopeptide (TPR) repeat protein